MQTCNYCKHCNILDMRCRIKGYPVKKDDTCKQFECVSDPKDKTFKAGCSGACNHGDSCGDCGSCGGGDSALEYLEKILGMATELDERFIYKCIYSGLTGVVSAYALESNHLLASASFACNCYNLAVLCKNEDMKDLFHRYLPF